MTCETHTCGARIEIPNGETVTPCSLWRGHAGRHRGTCLGSPFVWADEDTAPEDEGFAAPAVDDEWF